MARKAWLISADMPKDFRDTKQNSRKMKRVRKQQLKKGAKWKYGMTHAKDRIAKSGVRMDARPGEVKVIYSKDLGIDLREKDGKKTQKDLDEPGENPCQIHT